MLLKIRFTEQHELDLSLSQAISLEHQGFFVRFATEHERRMGVVGREQSLATSLKDSMGSLHGLLAAGKVLTDHNV